MPHVRVSVLEAHMVLRRFSTMLVMGVTLTVSLALYLVLSQFSDRLDTGETQTVSLGLLELDIPTGFSPCDNEFRNDWHVTGYCLPGNVHLQLAWAEGDPDQYASLAGKYFFMPEVLKDNRVVRYRANGSWWMVRKMPVGEGGVYAMRTRGKGRVATVFFGAGSRLYWVSMYTGSTLAEQFDLFHRIIQSLRWDGHAIAGIEGEQIMKRTCRDGYYLFCQPLWIFSVFPVVIGLIVVGIIGTVGRRMGRLPEGRDTKGQIPFFQEADVDASMSSRGRTSVVRVALLVYPDEMVLTMFGRPRIRVPHDRKNGIEIRRVKGFLGNPALEIEGNAKDLVTKESRFTSGRWKIRVYCSDPDRVLAYLG